MASVTGDELAMTRHTSQRRHRRSIRLRGYNYARPGAYFVTICTHARAPLFGHVVDGEMVLNEYGEIVREEWMRSAEIRAEIELFPEEFVVMPNHIHGIVWIVVTDDPAGYDENTHPTVGAHGRAPEKFRAHSHAPLHRPPRSLGSFIAGFKSSVTKRINARRGTPGAPVWQRNYYEHIIRTERALRAIRRYIIENPLRWHLDRYNPHATGRDPQARALWQMLQADARIRPYDHVHGHPGTGERPIVPDDHDDHANPEVRP